MTNKHKQILMWLFNAQFQSFQWNSLLPKEVGQGKRFYKRISDLEAMEYICVMRRPGEKSLYFLTREGHQRITDVGEIEQFIL